MSTENVTPPPTPPNPEKLELRGKLAAKICAIMGECSDLPKNGYNQFHNYSYVRESDAVNGIRVLLAKHKVAIMPILIKEVLVSSAKNSKGNEQHVTKADIQYKVIDAETGYQEVIPWAGYGQDTGEKGLYKAITGSHKYFLMKTFQISAGEEQMDPENERRGGQQQGQQQKPGGNRPPQGQHRNQAQQNRNQGQRQQQAPPKKPQHPPDPLATLRTRLFAEGLECGYSHAAIKELMAAEYPKAQGTAQLSKLELETLIHIMHTNPLPKVGSDEDMRLAAQETSQFEGQE